MGSVAVRTRAKRKTAVAKANATIRTLRCSNFPDALAKKSTVANKNSVREILTGNATSAARFFHPARRV